MGGAWPKHEMRMAVVLSIYTSLYMCVYALRKSRGCIADSMLSTQPPIRLHQRLYPLVLVLYRRCTQNASKGQYSSSAAVFPWEGARHHRVLQQLHRLRRQGQCEKTKSSKS